MYISFSRSYRLSGNRNYRGSMLKRVVLLISLLISAVCNSSQIKVIADNQVDLKALSNAQKADERVYVSRLYALFRIVDPKFTKNVLERAPDYSHFRDRVDGWIGDNQERWSEIEDRLNYCQDMLQRGQLGSEIDDAEPDIRWRLFLEDGVPQDQLILPGRFSQGDTVSTVWTIIWPSGDSGQRGQEISCWSRSGLKYPTEVIPSDEEGFPSASPIWPFVNYSRFPSTDGTVDLWFSVWVPGDQFTRPTLDKGQLSIRIDLYDSSRTILVASGEETSSLQMIRGILKVVERHDRHLTRAMGFIGFTRAKPGRYNAHLTILGAPYNEGEQWLEVDIPAEEKISDLLILEPSMVNSDNMLAGIVRGEPAGLYDNPECRLKAGAECNLYLEATLPEGHGEHFEVWATLLRVPEISHRQSATITTGEPVVLADSLDLPFANGEWHSFRNRKLLEEMACTQSNLKSSGTVTLLRKQFRSPEAGVVTVRVAPELGPDLKSGQYLLTVTISDPERGSYFLSTKRVIRIAPS